MLTKEPIVHGNVYHLYNHANGNINLFRSDENYRFFLEKYAKYVTPYFDTYAYCLMPNHFHFLVRVKDERVLSSENDSRDILKVTNAIKNWLISYTQSYHKVMEQEVIYTTKR
jgi:REP element-mobilizing transposase RayT